MFKMGDKVEYQGSRHIVLYIKEHIMGNKYDTENQDTGMRYMSIPEGDLTLRFPPREPVLNIVPDSIAPEPAIQLSYRLKLQGYPHDLTHKELKELQTVLNGVLL